VTSSTAGAGAVSGWDIIEVKNAEEKEVRQKNERELCRKNGKKGEI
jgi:hypothetical protein